MDITKNLVLILLAALSLGSSAFAEENTCNQPQGFRICEITSNWNDSDGLTGDWTYRLSILSFSAEGRSLGFQAVGRYKDQHSAENRMKELQKLNVCK